MQVTIPDTGLRRRLRALRYDWLGDERKFADCPGCGKHLSPGEISEQWCEECGPLTPREAPAARRVA